MVILLSRLLSDQISGISATNPPTERNIDILGTNMFSIKFMLTDDTIPTFLTLKCATLIFSSHSFPHIEIFLTTLLTLVNIFNDILTTFLKCNK